TEKALSRDPESRPSSEANRRRTRGHRLTMARAALFLALLFAALYVLRALRISFSLWRRGRGAAPSAPRAGEMARDPICGAWFDGRLAVRGRRDGEPVEVCSEGCRRRLEAS